MNITSISTHGRTFSLALIKRFIVNEYSESICATNFIWNNYRKIIAFEIFVKSLIKVRHGVHEYLIIVKN